MLDRFLLVPIKFVEGFIQIIVIIPTTIAVKIKYLKVTTEKTIIELESFIAIPR